MSKIGKLIPRPVKNGILWVARRPEKIGNAIYRAAAKGKIPFPDKAFVKWDYKIFSGKKLNLKTPTTFNEKLQWLKLNYHKPEFSTYVDKYAVREHVAKLVGEEVLIPCYGVFNQWEEIDFDALPKQFVIKCTHDSGSVAICRDKDTFDLDAARKKIEAGLARNQFYLSREWPYKNVPPRIMIEQFLDTGNDYPPADYKFFCFHGEPKLVLVCSERTAEDHNEIHMDMNWQPMPFDHGHPRGKTIPEKPINWNAMVSFSRTLSSDLPHIRVDFYEVNGKIYFGELTFFDSGGRMPFDPHSYDELLGSWITLPAKTEI